jgi:WS/DGAT/MGAT family acyltransferase
MSRYPMAPADAAWLRMDRPTNLMVVTSVMWLDGPLDRAALRDLLTDRVLDRFPRFSQRVVSEHGLFWEDVEDFDLGDHLHQVRLAGTPDRTALEEFTSSLVAEPLPHGRPLWDLYLVENFETGSALVFRMHHAIADGIALARLLMSLTDDADADPVAIDAPRGAHPGLVESGVEAALITGIETLVHPSRLISLADPRTLLGFARTAVADGAALAKLALLPADHHTALRGTVGVEKQVVWSDPVPLSRIRDAGHDAGATVNDVILAAVAGALRLHLVRRRSVVHDVRAIVPFNLRPLDVPLPAELGNMFGLVYLSLPLATARREDRLREMSKRMTAIKHSAEGLVSYGILALVGLAPAVVEDAAIDIFAAKGTGVMTNVPGPRRAVTLAGRRLIGTIGWGPTSGDLGLGVAVFSYDGSVTIGLCVDRGIVPNPKELLDDVLIELEQLILAHAGADAG